MGRPFQAAPAVLSAVFPGQIFLHVVLQILLKEFDHHITGLPVDADLDPVVADLQDFDGKSLDDCLLDARMVKAHKRHGVWKLCNCLKRQLDLFKRLNTELRNSGRSPRRDIATSN